VMLMQVTELHRCRLCGAEGLETVLDLGIQGLPKWPEFREEPVPRAPLEFCFCPSCTLGQLRHSIDREKLFREYWYRTGVNATMRGHMAGIVTAARKEAQFCDSDYVVDIGCNDGTLLRSYDHPGHHLIGFEPSNLCPPREEGGIVWVNDFFHPDLLPGGVRAKVVTTLSMFYYLDDPVAFAEQIKSILREDGVWICEMNYALRMVKDTTFDHISHEHVTTWSAATFSRVVGAIGLEIFRIEENDLNGGSIRFWMGFPGVRRVEPSVGETLAAESDSLSSEGYHAFAESVRRISNELREMVGGFKRRGKRVMCYGASTRGLTILGTAGIGSDLIEAAVERNEEKVGRFYGATGIPIISEAAMREDPPDALLILPYSFTREFIERESEFLRKGGVFIVPVPTPRLVEFQGTLALGHSQAEGTGKGVRG